MERMVLNPFAYDFHEDPYPTYRWLRDEAPAYRNEAMDFWALSRYTDVVEGSRDWQTFSSAEGTTLERLDPTVFGTIPMIIFLDPPRQIRLRKLVMKAFTPRSIADLEPYVRDLAVDLLEPLAAARGGDFVQQFSALLPMNVIFQLLGVDAADRDHLRQLTDRQLERDDGSAEVPERARQAMAEKTRIWFEIVAERRRTPRDDMITRLTQVELADDDADGPDTDGPDARPVHLTDGEVVGFCSLLGSAGNETVTKLLASAVVLLRQNPDELAKILDDPSRIPDAVEETLRYSSPSQYQGRTTTRDVELHGTTIPEGSRVLMLTGSANRDEREFPQPDRFHLDRPPHLALAFGHGTHLCLGTALARLESRVALEEFTKRFAEYEIDEDGLQRVHMSNVHGYSSVPFRG